MRCLVLIKGEIGNSVIKELNNIIPTYNDEFIIEEEVAKRLLIEYPYHFKVISSVEREFLANGFWEVHKRLDEDTSRNISTKKNIGKNKSFINKSIVRRK